MTSQVQVAAGNRAARSPASLKRRAVLTVAALGVVYGDIGTSPLYALRLSVQAMGGAQPNADAVLAALSLILWSLIVVVTIKYVIFILRADNKGEGGVLALAALAHRASGLSRRTKGLITFGAVAGLALFLGDGLLTPAISVLSAVEGLKVEQPALAPLVVPVTLAILIALFLIQYRGTERVGGLFGPIIFIWFAAIGTLGAIAIADTPAILAAVNPMHAIGAFIEHPAVAFVTLGAVVLAVTGVEALYADMGHFGRGPIRFAWIAVALPALLLNYFGQGAALLVNPAAVEHAFYSVVPAALHYPMVVLATLATIIASQAVISGVYSIVHQAVQLGMLPRMEIRHTSPTEFGQIYVPRANTLMLVGVVAVVLVFQTSDALATAYGIAVTGIMVISTLLVAVVARKQWGWSVAAAVGLFGAFALVDIAFLSANALKIAEGGWFPIAIAVGTLIALDTWRVGRKKFLEKVYAGSISTDLFLERADKTPIRIEGTAVYLTPRPDLVPGALLHNLKHNRVLHERVILLNVKVEDTPFVDADRRVSVNKLGKGFFAVDLRYGFFEDSDVPRGLEAARALGLAVDIDSTTFFVRRDILVMSENPAMARWRTRLFIVLSRASLDAALYFRLPPGRVVELGARTEI
jgi:KUP system potassium uptake protein